MKSKALNLVIAVCTIATTVLASIAAGTQPFDSSSFRRDHSRVKCLAPARGRHATELLSAQRLGGNHKACILSGTKS